MKFQPSAQRNAARARGVAALLRRALKTRTPAAQSAPAASERAVQLAEVQFVQNEGAMTWVDVVCRPSGLRLTARVASPTRSVAEVPREGDEVVVLLPRGELGAGAVCLAVVPTEDRPEPELASGNVHIRTDAALIADATNVDLRAHTAAVVQSEGSVTVRGQGPVSIESTATLQVQASIVNFSASAVALGGGGKGVARADDPVTIVLTSSVLNWLNAVGAGGTPGPFPTGNLSGTITGGSPSVTI